MSTMEALQKIKVGLILCSCFFAYGTHWSDWVFDYYILWADPSEHPGAVKQAALYYSTQISIPNLLRYIPIANLVIATAGFTIGLCTMKHGDMLFDGASFVLMSFGLATYITSVIPSMKVVTKSSSIQQTTLSLKQIAVSHFIIVLAITGIIGLQVTQYFVTNRPSKEYGNENTDEDDDYDEDDHIEEEEEEE